MEFYAVDTETTGLRMFHPRDRVIMITMCGPKGPTLHGPKSKEVRRILADPNIIKGFHNAKFDVPMLQKEGYKIRGPIHCSMIAMQLAYPELPQHGLKYLVRKYLDDDFEEDLALKEWQGKGKNKKPMWEAPAHIMGPYALKDAQHAHDIYYMARFQLKDRDMMDTFKREMKLMPVVSKMEKRGLLVDQERASDLLAQCRKETKALKLRLIELTGNATFNPNSPKQVIEAVYTGDTYVKRYTDSGQPSTDAVALLELNTELARGVCRYRELTKSGGTYLENILKGVDEEGVFRSSFNQARAITGRFSSSGYGDIKFNLQNIPRPDERKGVLGRIRECFVARPGYKLFFIDMDQIEMRLIAHFTQEQHMLDAIHAGVDLHDNTTKKTFKLKRSADNWKLMRYLSKTINFLVGYGGGAEVLQHTVLKQTAGEMFFPLEDCADYLEQYHSAHPMLQNMFDNVALNVADSGGVRNFYGRFCPVPARKSYVGVNYIVQGTAADYLKIKMLECADLLKRKRSNMLGTAHDELFFEIHYSEKKLVRQLRDIMEDYDTFDVPLTAGVDSGYRWGKKQPVKL